MTNKGKREQLVQHIEELIAQSRNYGQGYRKRALDTALTICQDLYEEGIININKMNALSNKILKELKATKHNL